MPSSTHAKCRSPSHPGALLGIVRNPALWTELTQFLRVPGAPIDNNICERALKKAILHRKNSLFFKTKNGARVGDIFLSLIHTAELNEADPFDYLTELLRHRDESQESPALWLPWSYRDT